MTQVNGAQSMLKTNLFRLGVGQPMVGARQRADTPANYCKNMMRVGMARAAQDEKQFTAFTTPVPDEGNNLFTFLAARLAASWGNLGCGALLNAPDPVNLTLDANGVATAATFSHAGDRHAARRGGPHGHAQRERRQPRLHRPPTATAAPRHATASPTATATPPTDADTATGGGHPGLHRGADRHGHPHPDRGAQAPPGRAAAPAGKPGTS